MKKILFICHGNICRSPMAEFAFLALARRAGVEVLAASAATSAEELGNPVHPGTRKKLAEHGIDCRGKRAVQLQRQDYQTYDLLLCMDKRNVQNATGICGGDPAGKIRRLLDYTRRPGDIADPWYTGDFDATWADVAEGCAALLTHLAGV